MIQVTLVFILACGACLLSGCEPSSGVSQYYKKPATTGKTDEGVRRYMKANELENLRQFGGREL